MATKGTKFDTNNGSCFGKLVLELTRASADRTYIGGIHQVYASTIFETKEEEYPYVQVFDGRIVQVFKSDELLVIDPVLFTAPLPD